MTHTGRFRVYFNRHGAAPLIWCVSPEDGGWEMAVSHVIARVEIRSVYVAKETADEDDGRPSGWFAAIGTLRINGSVAEIVP